MTSGEAAAGPGEADELPAELCPALRAVLLAAGIRALTAVQSRVLEPALRGQDVCACAPTGSGKTLAYALPLAQAHAPGDAGVRVLVLLPTRELAAQVAAAVGPVAGAVGLASLLCAGGTPLEAQEAALRGGGPHWVVGTPGRLRDLAARRVLQLGGLRCRVLDEADRLLDEGLLDDVAAVLRLCPATVQTMLLSATWTGEVDALAADFTRGRASTARVQVAAPGGGGVGGEVAHLALLCPHDQVVGALVEAHAVFAAPHGSACLAFCSTRLGAEALAAALPASLAHACLHGAMRQGDRDAALGALRGGRLDVLVATDVAARGLDIPRVTLVAHVSPPGDADTYVHRAGRAGRPGSASAGTSLVLFEPHQGAALPDLERAARITFHRITALSDAAAAGSGASRRRSAADHAQAVSLGQQLLVTDRLAMLSADLAELGAKSERRGAGQRARGRR